MNIGDFFRYALGLVLHCSNVHCQHIHIYLSHGDHHLRYAPVSEGVRGHIDEVMNIYQFEHLGYRSTIPNLIY